MRPNNSQHHDHQQTAQEAQRLAIVEQVHGAGWILLSDSARRALKAGGPTP